MNRIDLVSISGSRGARHHPHPLSDSPSQEVPLWLLLRPLGCSRWLLGPWEGVREPAAYRLGWYRILVRLREEVL